MLTLEKLKEFGADTETGLSRCAGSEMLYLRLVGMAVQELSSPALSEALNAGDLERAFQAAHKLKGGVCNLSLTPIAGPISELTELLRNRTPGDYETLLSTIRNETEKLKALL